MGGGFEEVVDVGSAEVIVEDGSEEAVEVGAAELLDAVGSVLQSEGQMSSYLYSKPVDLSWALQLSLMHCA